MMKNISKPIVRIDTELILLIFIMSLNLLGRSFGLVTGEENSYRVVLLAIGAYLLYKNNKTVFNQYKLYILVCVISLFSIISNGLTSISLFLRLISELGIAVSLLKKIKGDRFSIWAQIVGLIPLVYFTFMALSGISVKVFALDLVYSKNHIGIMAMFCVSLWFAVRDINDIKINTFDFIVASMYFLISNWVQSRGGIIAFFLFIAFFIPQYYNRKNSTSRFVIILLLFSLFLFALLNNRINQGIIDTYREFTNVFTRKGFDDIRSVIISAYLRDLNIYTFLFGGAKPSLLQYSNLSLHNSYLSMHSRMGAISLVIIIYFIKQLVTGFRNRTTRFRAFLLLMILIRSFTDTIFFSVFDSIILMISFSITEDLETVRMMKSNSYLSKTYIEEIE